jgi:uncharacterized protein YwgA
MPTGRSLPQEEGALRKQALPIARALNALSVRTGHSFTMRTQAGRFRIQKTVYLLRHMDYPAAQRFEFNIYLMGPYSPDLARAYYLLGDDGIRSSGKAEDIPGNVVELINEVSAKPDQFLEGLTTLLDVRTQTTTAASALAQSKFIKPHLSDSVWREVRAFLQQHPSLITAT